MPSQDTYISLMAIKIPCHDIGRVSLMMFCSNYPIHVQSYPHLAPCIPPTPNVGLCVTYGCLQVFLFQSQSDLSYDAMTDMLYHHLPFPLISSI